MDEMNNVPQPESTQPEGSQPGGTQQPDRKGLAVAALVLGIVSLVLFCIPYVSIPCAILGIIFGALSTKSSRRGMAIAGLVLAIVGAAVDVVIIIIGVSILSSIPYMNNYTF